MKDKTRGYFSHKIMLRRFCVVTGDFSDRPISTHFLFFEGMPQKSSRHNQVVCHFFETRDTITANHTGDDSNSTNKYYTLLIIDTTSY